MDFFFFSWVSSKWVRLKLIYKTREKKYRKNLRNCFFSLEYRKKLLRSYPVAFRKTERTSLIFKSVEWSWLCFESSLDLVFTFFFFFFFLFKLIVKRLTLLDARVFFCACLFVFKIQIYPTFHSSVLDFIFVCRTTCKSLFQPYNVFCCLIIVLLFVYNSLYSPRQIIRSCYLFLLTARNPKLHFLPHFFILFFFPVQW